VEPTTNRPQPSGRLKRVTRIGVPVLVLVVIVAIALVARGSEDDSRSTATEASARREGASEDDLVLSGPMTPQRAELEGVEVDFGPGGDEETGRLAIPSNYAPPCVEPFTGDNGGATSPGVTADTITVVAYESDPAFSAITSSITGDAGVDTDPEAAFPTTEDWVELYSDLFEQYGRQVELIRYVGKGSPDDPEQAKADAIDIAESYEPFAVIGAPC
jgi:hypothetical protein